MAGARCIGDAGADVAGPVQNVTRALALLAEQGVDAAVLDKNLDGETADPIADALVAQNVPFVFLTGYGSNDTEERHRGRRRNQPPCTAAKAGTVALLIPRGAIGTGSRTRTACDPCCGGATTGLNRPIGASGRTASRCSAPRT